MPRNETTLSPPNDYVVDVLEIMSITTITQILMRQGSKWATGGAAPGGSTDPATILNTSNVGTTGTTGANVLLDGQNWYFLTAAAAINGRQGPPLFPGLGYPFTGNPSASLHPLRFRLRGLLQRTAIAAGSTFGVGFRRTNGCLQRTSANQGFAIESDAGLNGGNWTILSRRAAAGAFVVSQDTGIPGSTRLYFDLQFDDTTAQSMLVTLNGTAFGPYTEAAAQLPLQAAGDTNLFAGIFQDSTGAVGTIDRFRQLRYTVYTLTGYPA